MLILNLKIQTPMEPSYNFNFICVPLNFNPNLRRGIYKAASDADPESTHHWAHQGGI